MGGRANDWVLRAGVLGAVYLTGAVCNARPDRIDPALETYAGFALLSNARVKVGPQATVAGSLHSNDGVELKKESTVTGDVSAVKEVKNQGGRVLGRVIQHAASVALPAMPDKSQARALADRVVAGPIELVNPRIDDVLFVTGAVRIVGSAQGSGTLIATGSVSVAASAGAAAPPLGGRLAILSYADLTMAAGTELHATVRAGGRAVLGDRATLEGTLYADREVELARGARLTFGPPADTTAPALTILGPPEPIVTAVTSLDLTVLYADADPGIDVASFSLLVDGAAATERCVARDNAAACSVPVAASGRRQIVASIRDLAANQATGTLAVDLVIDSAPPVIVVETPADGALVGSAEVMVRGTVTDDGAVALVTVDGAVVDAPGGKFARSAQLSQGANPITIVARDSTGKQSERTIVVTLDSTPPRVTLRTPAALALSTHLASVVVAGDAEDERGLDTIEVAGVPVGHAAGVFEREVPLAEGVNRIRIAATDRAGNVGGLDLEVARVTVPMIAISSPGNGELVLGQTVDVRGTIDDPQASVTVNSLTAAVAGDSFSLDALPIADGATLINVVATGVRGHQSTAGVTVIRDREAPTVSIHDPGDGSVVYEAAVPVTGMVNDVVVGTVNAAQVSVTVNGVAAEVFNRSFLLDRLPLAVGENTIEVVATDPSGNLGRDSVVVRRQAPVGPTISVASGDLQSATIGTALPLPLVVSLHDALGAPVAGRIVTFDADGTDGVLAGGRRQVAVATDAAGRAATTLDLGRRAGHHSVRATATGFAGEALFVVRAHAAEPAILVVDSGDQQVGAAGHELRAPLAAVVTDEGFNRIEGVAVHFEVVEGGGFFQNGGSSLDLVTDSDGRVTAGLTLGLEEGVGNNVAQARLLDGAAEAMVTFAASALVAKDPASTSVSGVVLDNTDQPVPGATVSLEGTTLQTRSDATGFFRLEGAPAGTTYLRVRGSTVERPGVWPSLEFLITIVAGRDNDMGRPIFLLPLDTGNALAVDETTGGVLTMRDLPGFALHVAPGSVTFPGGQRAGVITVTPVHSDKVPMPPNFGQQPRFVITIQPGGAHFDPPARVVFPNVDGLAPGQVTELYSFDHDLARFVSIGPGTVTGDGTRIESDSGVGIAKAGWHGGGDPARPGTCHGCSECKEFSGAACVADDSQVPGQKAPDDCRREHCRGGRVVSDMTNQESAAQVAGNCYEELCPEPHRAVDLADAPPGLACCGDPDKPLEGGIDRGVLTGIYDPDRQCCVDDGLRLISRTPPIDLDSCPDREAADPLPETMFDGCSVPDSMKILLLAGAAGLPYSGDRNEPTPGGDGDALFSADGEMGGVPELPCDRHDDCYQTCNNEKGVCDEEFLNDMLAVCDRVTGTYLVPVPDIPGAVRELDRRYLCMQWAGLYGAAVAQYGEPAFDSGQEGHCECICS